MTTTAIDYDSIITAEQIDLAAQRGACSAALEWLRAAPHTIGALCQHNLDWFRRAVCHVCPPDVLAALAGDANCDVRRAVAYRLGAK